jgi:hypothetical protein
MDVCDRDLYHGDPDVQSGSHFKAMMPLSLTLG